MLDSSYAWSRQRNMGMGGSWEAGWGMQHAGLWVKEVALRVFLLTATVMVASNSVFMFSRWCDTWLAIAACFGLLTAASCQWPLRPAAKSAVFAALAGCIWAAFKMEQPIARLVCLAWIFALMALPSGLRRRGTSTASSDRPFNAASWLFAAQLATLGYAVAGGVYERSNSLWFLIRNATSFTAPPRLHVGVWVSGLPVFAFGSMILLSKASLEGGRPRNVLFAAAPIVGMAVATLLLARLTPVTQLKVSCCHLAAIGLVAALAALDSRVRGRPGVVVHPTGDRSRMTPASWMRSMRFAVSVVLTAGCLFLIYGHSTLAEPRPTPARSRPSFGLYAAGLLDWLVPTDGRIGLANSGMFGLFRRTLEHSAAKAGGRVLEVGPVARAKDCQDATPGWIQSAAFADMGIMVFINPTVKLAPEQAADLRRFVEAGGGLLVLGDHTNIGGSMEPLNTILSFTGIRFNFDSAVPLRERWRGCLEIRPHPVTAGLGDDLLLQLAVGASLRIERPAFPVVVGRYGFADRGDSLNAGPAAFLGNLVQNRGEQVGDVVLVAGERVGRGRVLVFGDTSPFQNAALFLSQRLVANAVAWLACPDGGQELPARGASALPPPEERVRFSDVIAEVDFSLRPRASLASFKGTSLGGLANCLARAGIQAQPALSRSAWTERAAFLFLVGPTRLGRRDVARLLAYMNGGGNLILCQGWAEAQPCASLAARLGFRIANIPLGSGDGIVVHKDAWALSCIGDAPDTTVMASAFGYPTIVQRPFGRGTFTIIGDCRFLLDENLEGERGGEPRNIAFVGHLVTALLAEKPAVAWKGGDHPCANSRGD
jgi:hypothetical protein